MKIRRKALIVLLVSTLVVSFIPTIAAALYYQEDADYHYFSTFRNGIPLGSQLTTKLTIHYDYLSMDQKQVSWRGFFCVADKAYVTFNGDMGIAINYLRRYDNSSLARTLYETDLSPFSPLGGYDPFKDEKKFKCDESVVNLAFEYGDKFEFKGKVVYWLPASLYTTSSYYEYLEVEFNY